MSVKQTKKLSDQPTTTTVSINEKFAKVDTNGKVTLISLDNLCAQIFGGLDLNAALNGVFILYHHKNDNEPYMARPDQWLLLQTAGQVADGVVIVEGCKVLVVAPTDCGSTGLQGSSGPVNNGASAAGGRLEVINDWNGKAHTEVAIANSTSSATANTSAYAPGYCKLYSRGNANGKGLMVGDWWLPSMGELLMIFANKTKINYALSLISGATQLAETWHWSSSNTSSEYAYHLNFANGAIFSSNKFSYKGRVRPVSTIVR